MSKIVMYDSDEAATYRHNIGGWVDRHGVFCGKDEDLARYRGCTHRPCSKCGKPAPKSYTVCDECQRKTEADEYEMKMECLRLLICEPVFAHGIDPEEYYHDLLPTNGEDSLPTEIKEASEKLNEVIRPHGGCPWCEGSRLYQDRRDRAAADQQIEKWLTDEENKGRLD